ncbi:hypothetical protein [Vibrio sp. 661]|uniref:hypothetical protein n=1 Tax=Vibrio sp. 661 TaxID=3074608 RepID=UPI0029643D83|nr:hypothetical protein [Vibrio sp. 661]MDW1961352.1 hypothetical protein [Vibrio sp. 661]
MKNIYISNKIFTSAILTCLLLVSGCTDEIQQIAEKQRIEAKWEAVNITEKTLKSKAIDQGYDVSVFLSSKDISALLNQLYKTRVIYNKDGDFKGWGVVVDSAVLSTTDGESNVFLDLSVYDNEKKFRGTLELEALLLLSHLERNDDSNHTNVFFGFKPTKITPKIRWWQFWLSLPSTVNELIVDLLEVKEGEGFLLPVAVPNQISKQLGSELTEEIQHLNDKDEVIGTTILKINVPNTEVVKYFNLVSPVFLKEGIWLALDLDSQENELPTFERPDGTIEELNEDVTNKLAQISLLKQSIIFDMSKSGSIFSKKVIENFLDLFDELPPENKKISIASTRNTGEFSKTNWHDDVLGKGGFYVKFVDDKSIQASVSLGKIESNWDTPDKLSFNVTTSVQATAKIHAHVDPLIGGGVGTSVGLKGKSRGEFGGSLNMMIDQFQSENLFILMPFMECKSIPITVKTDGRLKFSGGWVSVPSIGVTIEQLVNEEPNEPIVMVSSLPNAFALNETRKGAEKSDLTVTFPNNFLSSKFKNLMYNASASSMSVSYEIELEQFDSKDKFDALQIRSKKIIDEYIKAKLSKTKNCPDSDSIAVHLGPLEFGENNELVKFIKALGKSAEELKKLLEKAGAEASIGKVDEWLKNPEDSAKRGCVGRLLRGKSC